MKKDHAHISFILDRSGSMHSLCSEAIGGFNAFVESQRAAPGTADLSLLLFDHEYTPVLENVDLRTVQPLTAETYQPRGTTALLDAIGRTIDDLGTRLAALPERARPGKVIVAILTDGFENASRRYTRERVSAQIRHQQEKYDWEFVFLAANQDAIASAAALSIAAGDAVSFDATAAGVREAYAMLDREVSRRRAPAHASS